MGSGLNGIILFSLSNRQQVVVDMISGLDSIETIIMSQSIWGLKPTLFPLIFCIKLGSVAVYHNEAI
jgi:hypothetical protein